MNTLTEGRTVVPMVIALKDHHDQLRVAEIKRARRLLAGGVPAEKVLERLASGLTNKFLHAPTDALRQADAAERAELLSLLHHIYPLPRST
jgi:glutamyl-tRNA reductase